MSQPDVAKRLRLVTYVRSLWPPTVISVQVENTTIVRIGQQITFIIRTTMTKRCVDPLEYRTANGFVTASGDQTCNTAHGKLPA